jgi:[acyl-carrier-protein] S-malonyltransferase
MTRLAILCPGQGAQHARMFDLVDARRCAALSEAWPLERSLDDLLSDEQAMFANRYAQPLIVAATLAVWTELKQGLPPPAVVAGYSIGELSAHAVAGALSPADAIAAAAMRAKLMDDCTDGPRPQSLLSASVIDVLTVRSLLPDGEAFIAIETAEDSCIIGGYADALGTVQARLQALGARCGFLPVEVASHTPLMAGAVTPFADVLGNLPVADPAIPVISGIAAEAVTTRTGLLESLPRQIGETIRWRDCMDALAEAGISVALELGPGAALSRMLQARHPGISCRSVAEFRSLAGVTAWVARHF